MAVANPVADQAAHTESARRRGAPAQRQRRSGGKRSHQMLELLARELAEGVRPDEPMEGVARHQCVHLAKPARAGLGDAQVACHFVSSTQRTR